MFSNGDYLNWAKKQSQITNQISSWYQLTSLKFINFLNKQLFKRTDAKFAKDNSSNCMRFSNNEHERSLESPSKYKIFKLEGNIGCFLNWICFTFKGFRDRSSSFNCGVDRKKSTEILTKAFSSSWTLVNNGKVKFNGDKYISWF